MIASLTLGHIVILIAVGVISFITGFLFKKLRQKNLQKSIVLLEEEMLKNHAQILHLQKELADKNADTHKTPIVSISNPSAEPTTPPLASGKLRKQALTQAAKTKS